MENMQNTEENRVKLAEATWESLSLDSIRERFIFQECARYVRDNDAFEEDAEHMGFNDEGQEMEET